MKNVQTANELIQSSIKSIGMQHLPITLQRRCEAIREKYPSPESLLLTFNPDTQVACVEQGNRCFTGMAPTLYEVRLTYGGPTAEMWLEIQLRDLSEFAGCREKMSEVQIENAAQTIILHFGFLKITELMVFLQQFKAGIYGKFYGVVDGLVITEALQGFMRFRADKLRSIETARLKDVEQLRLQDRERQLAAGELLTMSEWEEIRWLFNLGYEKTLSNI